MSQLKTLDSKTALRYIFASSWIIWVIIQYLGYRSNYLALFYDHPYSGYLTLIGLVSVAIGGFSYYTLRKRKKWVLSLRPWWLIILTLILSTSVLIAFRQSNNLNITPAGTATVYFWFYSITYIGTLLVLGLSLAGLGQFASSRIPLNKPSSLLSLAIGVSFFAFYSVLLGLAGLLNTWTLWPALIVAVFFQRKYLWEILQSWLLNKIEWRIRYWWQLPVAFVGLLVIATYWLGGLKAFPVGFDGAALYANLAHLTAEQNTLPASYQAFGWSVVMSWGELLFGSISVSILLSQFMFLPAAVLLYQIFRHWLKPAYALVAIVLTFSIAMWSFHAMADEKIDLGFLFICLSVVYLLLDVFGWKKTTEKQGKVWQNPFMRALVLVGWLSGFAFSIKYTAIFLLAAWVAVLCYHFGKSRLLAFWLFFFFGFLFISGFHSWGNIPIQSNSEALLLGGGFIIIAIGFLVSSILRDNAWIKKATFGLVLAALAFGVSFAPWGGKHLAENRYEPSINNILFGSPKELPMFIPDELLSYERRNNQSPRDYQFQLTGDQEGPNSQQQTREERQANRKRTSEEIESFDLNREEVQRYIGYEDGILRYTSIPFDLTFDQNVRQVRHKDIGFIYLALLPLLFLAFSGGAKSWLRNSLVLFALIGWITSSFWSITQATSASSHHSGIQEHNQSFIDLFTAGEPVFLHDLMNALQAPFNGLAAQAAGIFASLGSLSLLVYIPLLVLLLAGSAYALRHRWRTWPQSLRLCMVFSFTFLAYWLFLGNAIVWYALPAFALTTGLIIYYWQEKEALWGEGSSKGAGLIIGTVILAQLVINILVLYASNMPGQPPNKIFNWPMVEYVSQPNVNKDKVYGWFSQYYQKISKEVNSNPEDKIIRINTYLQYHLDENNNRVLEDNQLNAYKRIADRLKSPTQFVDVLKSNGFKYIIYDINTPTIDETPEQSLREKCSEFLRVMATHREVEVLVTDNYVADASAQQPTRLPNGQMAKAKPGIIGETVYRGSVILFGIKQ